MTATGYEIDYEDVKKGLLAKDPDAAYEYRKNKPMRDFGREVFCAAGKLAEKRGVPAEEVDRELAEKSGLGFKRYMAFMADEVEITLVEAQQLAMALGCDIKVVLTPHNREVT